MRRIICVILSVVMMFQMNLVVYAGEVEPENAVITCVRDIDSDFLITSSEIEEDTEVLFSPLGYTELTDFIEGDDYIGYAITIDGVVVEFAQQESPYHKFSDMYEEYIFYYDYANYGFMDNNMPICFDIDGIIKDQNLLSTDISTRAVLPGVTPQLQESYNCIAAALSNIMWYWGSHGYPSLISGKTFTGVKNSIQSLFVSYGQGFANNAVPQIANLYGSEVSPNVSFNASTVWTNSPATMVNEIDHGYPCMVGFAAGPPPSYSEIAGHMTMCFGYYYSGTTLYIVLADGHSDSSVTKIWSSYNDCTIKLRPY